MAALRRQSPVSKVGYSGHLDHEAFPQIVKILTDLSAKAIDPAAVSDELPEPSTDAILHALRRCPDATVTHRVTGEEVHRPERRKCKRLTFTNQMVIHDLVKEVETSIYRCTPVDHLQVERSHGDILLYEKGEYFDWHRDTVPGRPKNLPSGSAYYTMLLGLITTEKGGSTSVRASDTGTVHTFDNSCEAGGFVLFKSDSYHCGNAVLEGCKMVLKLDFWCTVNPSADRECSCDCRSCRDYYDEHYEPSDDDDDWCNGYHLDY